MNFHIAPLQPSDKECWAALWTEYQIFYRTELPPDVTEATWQRMHDGRIRGMAARDCSDALVGIVHYLFHEDTWSIKPACYLQDLYVDPASRGRGCARRLIEAVAASASEAGAAVPYWLTHESNTTARQLYDRLASNLGFMQYVYAAH